MNPNILNLNKTDLEYKKTPLFLGPPPGLVDSVNKQYPTLWTLYKKMKSLDWSEDEFDYSPCVRDFATCDRSIYDAMIKTLSWQWMADSVVSRSISAVVAPFISSSELWVLWQRISDNESIHALTYSEIVRNSFEDPDVVIQEILRVTEAVARVTPLTTTLEKTFEVSHKLALGQIAKDSDEAYDAIFLFTVAVWILERGNFPASFAVTFAIVETGIFMPIGKAVQKIAQDELEIHALTDRAILDIELQTSRGQAALERNRSVIKDMIDSFVASEEAWTNYLFSDGKELLGLTQPLLFQWVLYNIGEIYQYFNIPPASPIPEKNPIKFMENWLSINKIQSSPQEEKLGNYMLGQVVDNLGEKSFEIDF